MFAKFYHFALPAGTNFSQSGILTSIKAQIEKKMSQPEIITDLQYHGIKISNNEVAVVNVFKNFLPVYTASFSSLLNSAEEIKSACVALGGTTYSEELEITNLSDIYDFNTFTKLEVVDGVLTTNIDALVV